MRKLSLEPPEGGFVVGVSLECSSCHLFFPPGDLGGGMCAGCAAVAPVSTRLCVVCEVPTPSNRHRYCVEHLNEALDRRALRPGGRPRTQAQVERARERERRRAAAKRPHDALVYNAEFRRARRGYKPSVDAGLVDCWRCGTRILPGEKWHLGHVDGDVSRIAGPEHVRCNCATAKRDRRRAA